MAKKFPITEWTTCTCCGGDIPPETQWGKSGEQKGGYCPGQRRRDGMCRAFATRDRYELTTDEA